MTTPVFNAGNADHVTDAGATSFTLESFTLTAGSNRLLEVVVTTANAGTGAEPAPTGVTWGGVALTYRGAHLSPSNFQICTKWFLLEEDFPSGATGDIVASWALPAAYRGLTAVGFNDVDQSGPYRNGALTTLTQGSTFTPEIDVSSASGDLVSAGIAHFDYSATLTGWIVTEGVERTGVGPLLSFVGLSAATVEGAATATVQWTWTDGPSAAAYGGLIVADSIVGAKPSSLDPATRKYLHLLVR